MTLVDGRSVSVLDKIPCWKYCFLTTNKNFARWKIPVNWLVKTRFGYWICKKIAAHF